MLISLFQLAATQNSSAPTTTSSVSMTPEMSASAVSSLYSVLATSSPQQPGNGKSRGLEVDDPRADSSKVLLRVTLALPQVLETPMLVLVDRVLQGLSCRGVRSLQLS